MSRSCLSDHSYARIVVIGTVIITGYEADLVAQLATRRNKNIFRNFIPFTNLKGINVKKFANV